MQSQSFYKLYQEDNTKYTIVVKFLNFFLFSYWGNNCLLQLLKMVTFQCETFWTKSPNQHLRKKILEQWIMHIRKCKICHAENALCSQNQAEQKRRRILHDQIQEIKIIKKIRELNQEFWQGLSRKVCHGMLGSTR